MSNRYDIQFTRNPHNKAAILDCNFLVTPSNGAGVTSLNKSGRIASVFMHTTTTPSGGNPNPASGLVIVNLQDNYNTYLAHYASLAGPLSGSSISISGTSVMTVGNVYVITALGTTTQAQWQTAGLSSTITAAVGVSFIAAITGGGTGTGTVQAPATAGANVQSLELVGNSDLMNNTRASITLGAGIGRQLIFACYDDGVLAAPATGTKISVALYLNNSAQGV